MNHPNQTEHTNEPDRKALALLRSCEKQLEELEAARREIERELEEMREQKELLGERSALHLRVSHEKFGAGTVIREEGKYIDVRFSSVVKRFVLPTMIANHCLQVADGDTLAYYIRREEFRERGLQAQLQLRSTEFAIERVTTRIQKLKTGRDD